MTNRFLVEKHSRTAELYLADGRVLNAALFLADFAQNHAGAQTVRDLIEEPGEVIPARVDDGRFVLVNKAAIGALSVKPDPLDLEGYWHEVPATLRLVGGHQLTGDLMVEDGSGERLSDVINHSGGWLRLRSSDRLTWVHLAALTTAQSPDA